ncbi:GNAT family N-acetyltransferase [Streptomyces sp. NPDC059828]|uniref:GNAT family N-acetyltransferase n=1 Tax=Streptomyces sp. NPDC059828 TaxID=3346965 RepID=UPI00366662F5
MTETRKTPQLASRPIAQQEAYALLTDGTTVRIRPVLPSDHARVPALYEEMSPENLRLRFFTVNRCSAERSADRLCASAVPGRRALLAESGDTLVGLAEYERVNGMAADVGLAVSDRWHHRGVGTLMLEHLVSLARADGRKEACPGSERLQGAMSKVGRPRGQVVLRTARGVRTCSIATSPKS